MNQDLEENFTFKSLGTLRLRHLELNRIQVSSKYSGDEDKIINIYENVQVYDYAYRAFHKLRDEDGITPDVIKASLNPEANIENAKSAGEGAGKSGSFFVFSHDRKFIIKTMFESELDAFMFELENYFMHLDNNRDSLLVRIYGVFQVKMKGLDPINFVLMANTIKFNHKNNIKAIYDLKGSLEGRYSGHDEFVKKD